MNTFINLWLINTNSLLNKTPNSLIKEARMYFKLVRNIEVMLEQHIESNQINLSQQYVFKKLTLHEVSMEAILIIYIQNITFLLLTIIMIWYCKWKFILSLIFWAVQFYLEILSTYREIAARELLILNVIVNSSYANLHQSSMFV